MSDNFNTQNTCFWLYIYCGANPFTCCEAIARSPDITIRLFVSFDHIISTDNNIADRIISAVILLLLEDLPFFNKLPGEHLLRLFSNRISFIISFNRSKLIYF